MLISSCSSDVGSSDLDAISRLGIDEHMPQASLAVAVNHDSLETWIMQAAELFAARTRNTLDLQSKEQDHTAEKIGRAPSRESGGQYEEIQVGAERVNTKVHKNKHNENKNN